MDISKIGVGGQTYDIKDATARETAENAKGLELIGKFFAPFTAYEDEYAYGGYSYSVDSDFVDALILAKVAFLSFGDGVERKSLSWSIQDNGSWNESNVDFSLTYYSVATLGECFKNNGMSDYWIELYR